MGVVYEEDGGMKEEAGTAEVEKEIRRDAEPVEEAQLAEEEEPETDGASRRVEDAQAAAPLPTERSDGREPSDSALDEQPPIRIPNLKGPARQHTKRLLVKKAKGSFSSAHLKPEQRILILDTWRRSGLPAGDFADLIGLSKHTLYAWKKRFDESGPAGLMEQPKGVRRGSRLPEVTKRTILMLKESNPSWGCQRISDMLVRGPALPASATTVGKVLKEAGYELHEEPTRAHPDKVRRFERAKPNQLWQTDLFTFMLKRQNRRVYLVAFMDDHSRFIVSYGLHASQSSALVLEVLRSGLANYGTPEEILTDNGSQYITWRGKSAFTKELEKRGIRQVVARPRRPQTLGKVERFWGTLWRECLEASVFLDLSDARTRIGLFMDYYNFQRVHSGIGGLVPADRFFGAAPEVLKTLKARVAAHALELARNGTPKKPFYLTGQVGDKAFSVHAEGERVILTRQAGEREEIELNPQGKEEGEGVRESLPQPVSAQGIVDSAPEEVGNEEPPAPGTSPLDEHFPVDTEGAEGAVESEGGAA